MLARRPSHTRITLAATFLLAAWLMPLAAAVALAGHELAEHHHHGAGERTEHHHHDGAAHAAHDRVLELLAHGHEHDADMPPHEHDGVLLDANGWKRSGPSSVKTLAPARMLTPLANGSSIATPPRMTTPIAHGPPPNQGSVLLL